MQSQSDNFVENVETTRKVTAKTHKLAIKTQNELEV